MDINEDINRAETATRTIRTFAELENESGEEFIGYAAVEDSQSESDGQAEDGLTLKVRLPKYSPHLTGDQQSTSTADQSPPSTS